MRRLILALSMFSACGGTGSGQIMAGPCSTTVSGGVDGTVKCNGETISYVSVDDTSLFSLSGGAVGSTTAGLETGSLTWKGMPAAPGSYSPPTVMSADCSVSQMVNGKKHAWIVRFQPTPPANEPNVGTFQLSLTSTTKIVSTSASDQYFAHGSADLTLIDQDPMPLPQVNVTATF